MEDFGDEDEEKEYNREIEAIYNLDLSQSTRDSYQGRLLRFITYLRRTDPDLILTDKTFNVKHLHIKQFQLFLLENQDVNKVSFGTLKVKEFLEFSSSLDLNELFLELPDSPRLRLP
jgi:hypothetical protein